MKFGRLRKNFAIFCVSPADEPIAEITKSDLIAFRNALSSASGLASKTVNHHIKCAKMLFRAARRDGALSEDPAEFVDPVHAGRGGGGVRTKRPFSIEEVRALLSAADPEWKSLVLFGLYTGQRSGSTYLVKHGSDP